ncbi:ribonuclease III [Trueperella pecoris]|uniref:Ribonuclease 3 n=1 Tax=Trueperella pecoris TaxID=2733571 RepID=A0A7M1QU57_9ACTO|nr:ribonuclease III [Trueperella pecoris]QOQ38603.1 ribonuclease III [Trueperella pecoris]QOR44905.1 ribonuclease III [Trueperella pecoris]QTG74814.1 ribonuclease III [Trueperella pecoris]
MHKRVTSAEVAAWGAVIAEEYLQPALTHRSWAYENEGEHAERLEFLGDSILGFVVASYIFNEYPNLDEGDMSKIKAAAVSERSLAQIARGLHLGDYIKLGRGEEMSGGRDKDSILADTVEALIGATYLTYGVEKTTEVVLRHLIAQVDAARDMGPALDWRTAFEEKSRARGIAGNLTYEIEGTGPDHARVYTAHVFVDGTKMGSGSATSQKQAKLEACQAAYYALDEA